MREYGKLNGHLGVLVGPESEVVGFVPSEPTEKVSKEHYANVCNATHILPSMLVFCPENPFDLPSEVIPFMYPSFDGEKWQLGTLDEMVQSKTTKGLKRL